MDRLTIKCDSCGKEFEIEGTWTRAIAKDKDGKDIIEQYFDCEGCGKRYTVSVIDEGMRKMIRRRQQIRKMISMHVKNKSRESTIRRLQKEDEALKEELMKRSKANKERFKEE